MAFLGIDVAECIDVKYGESLSAIEDSVSRDNIKSILTEASRDFINRKLQEAQVYYDQLEEGLKSLSSSASSMLAMSTTPTNTSLVTSVTVTMGTATLTGGGTAAASGLVSGVKSSQKSSLSGGVSTCVSLLSSLTGVLSDLGIQELPAVKSGLDTLSESLEAARVAIRLL